ncbi:MAG TPA: hypothetical protein VGS22_08220 [Thermoanaerobaculia bacterium]|jgi:photosystem II stability/assembly factor-like uncharacterized protein|nr:hypothetical protein [Thermoanaerobaculia bacterium]
MPDSNPNSSLYSLGRTLLAFTLFAGLSVPAIASERWVPLGPSGGMTQLLVQGTSDPQRLYATTEGLGLFRSRDGGHSWQSASRGLGGFFELLHLAVDPSDPNIVFASTFGGARYYQIWRTADGGETWIPAARPPKAGRFLVQTQDFLFDATSPSTIYAATTSGIFRSSDGGATWNSWAIPSLDVFAIARDPAAPAVWYASARRFNDDYGIYRSDDGGVTWRATASLGGPGFGVLPLRLFFRAGSLYALWNGALYRSRDGATTWSLAARLQTLEASDFALAPSGSIYAATYLGVYASTDGVRWSPAEATSIDQAAPSDGIAGLALLPGGSASGGETVIAAGARGIWRSTDRGSSWHAASRGIVARNAGSLTVLSNPQGTLLGTFTDGLFRIDRASHTWQRLRTTESFEETVLAADPHHPGRVYALGETVAVSEDRGNSWRTVGNFTHSVNYLLRVDPVHPDVLYAGVGIGRGSSENGFAFRSVDGGATWTEILSFEYLLDLTFDPAHPNVGFRLTDSGIDKSTDGGGTWARLPGLENQLLGSIPTSLVFDPRTRSLFVGTNFLGVFRSTDGGGTFRRINAGLPRQTGGFNPSVTTLVRDAAGTVYAGLFGSGVFRLQPGQGWAAVNRDLPVETFQGKLIADPARPGLLYAGTHGSGVLRLENP